MHLLSECQATMNGSAKEGCSNVEEDVFVMNVRILPAIRGEVGIS